MRVVPDLSRKQPHWLDFPAVRVTLARWGVLPEGVRRQEVAKTGLRVRKILTAGDDPVATVLQHFRKFPPDLIVLATHQRDGLARWLHKTVAEPLARCSGAMTLFIPHAGRGFVSLKDGTVALKRIFIRRGCPGGYFAIKDLNSEAVDASGFLSAYLSSEMALKPLRRQARHFLQGTRLLKQMGRSWDHRQMFLSFELFISLPIEIDDNIVEPTNDE